MKKFRSLYRRGQYVAEYALIIAVAAAALLTMQAYFKRGIQGKIKEGSDSLGEEYSYNNTLTRSVKKVYATVIAEIFEKDKYSADIGASIKAEDMFIGNLKDE